MKLTIFSRLVIGYFTIFALAMAVSIYTIAQLRQLEDITRSILRVDNRLIDLEQKLSDALLSMMRYEKKYIIIKDEALYRQFLLSRDDFKADLKAIMAVPVDDRVATLIDRISLYHQRYQSLFAEEVKYLRIGRHYPEEGFKQKKDDAVNGMLADLKKLKGYSQTKTYAKIKQLNEAEIRTIKAAVGMTAASLILAVLISTVITVKITRPLSLMKKKTGEIAAGNFGDDLKISSPPEIKDLAQALNSMCSRLREIDKMKSDFFSLMSHELRTPLTTIREGTNLLMEGLRTKRITEKQKRLLAIITEESDRLIRLVNSLLDLSKMEAGMMVYNFSRTDLAALINKAAREMEPLAETKNIRIEISTEEGLPQVTADTERILQVLRNLIGNAVKFTSGDGLVRIAARALEREVRVSVSDTGAGIAKESLNAIFDKFRQDDLTSSSRIKGTGLGLSIVRHIITTHGGRVWAESTLGQGSTFTFVLPV